MTGTSGSSVLMAHFLGDILLATFGLVSLLLALDFLDGFISNSSSSLLTSPAKSSSSELSITTFFALGLFLCFRGDCSVTQSSTFLFLSGAGA